MGFTALESNAWRFDKKTPSWLLANNSTFGCGQPAGRLAHTSRRDFGFKEFFHIIEIWRYLKFRLKILIPSISYNAVLSPFVSCGCMLWNEPELVRILSIWLQYDVFLGLRATSPVAAWKVVAYSVSASSGKAWLILHRLICKYSEATGQLCITKRLGDA